jgi:hypothetical protein
MTGIPKNDLYKEVKLIWGKFFFTQIKSDKPADLFQIELYPKPIFRFGVQSNEPWTVGRQPLTYLPHLIALREGLPIRPHTL